MAAGPTYEALATTTLNSNQATVSFSSISGNYTDLILIAACKSSDTTNDYDALKMRFNSDTGSNYSSISLLGDGGSVTSSRESNQTALTPARLSSDKSFAGFDATIIHIQNYSNTTKNKVFIARGNSPQEYYEVAAVVGLWRSTAAINTILLYPAVGASFKSGSTFTLYGIASA